MENTRAKEDLGQYCYLLGYMERIEYAADLLSVLKNSLKVNKIFLKNFV